MAFGELFRNVGFPQAEAATVGPELLGGPPDEMEEQRARAQRLKEDEKKPDKEKEGRFSFIKRRMGEMTDQDVRAIDVAFPFLGQAYNAILANREYTANEAQPEQLSGPGGPPAPAPAPGQSLPNAQQAAAGGTQITTPNLNRPLGGAVAASGGGGGGRRQGVTAPAVDTQLYQRDQYERLMADYNRQQAAYEKQLEGLQADPDYSKLQAQMAERQLQGGDQMIAAAMAGLAPEEFQGLQKAMVEQAQAYRKPMPVEGGVITPEGEVMIDPAYKRQKQIADIQKRIEALDKIKLTATTAQERAKADRDQMELKSFLAAILANTRISTAKHFTPTSGTGMGEGGEGGAGAGGAGAGAGPGGKGVTFDALPKGAKEFEHKTFGLSTQALQMLPDLIADIKRHPEAFGIKEGWGEKLGALAETGTLANLTPQQQAVRSRLFTRYAHVIHELIGASQTVGEFKNLIPFIPQRAESAESFMPKLLASLQESIDARAALRQRFNVGLGQEDYLEATARQTIKDAYKALENGEFKRGRDRGPQQPTVPQPSKKSMSYVQQ